MEGDLLSSLALASILRTQTAKNESPTQQVQGVQVGITSDQINQLSDSIGQAVRGAVQGIQLPDINVPPAQVQFPSNLQLAFSDAELEKLATALAKQTSGKTKLIETRVLTLDVDGNTCTADFPTIKRLLSYQFTQSYYLVAVTISCSIVNTDTAVAGLFFGRDLGEQVNIAQESDTQTASDIYISQLTHQNSTVSTIAPLSRTNTIAFSGDQQFIRVQAGSRLALYGCGINNSNNLYSAVINLHILAEDG